WLPASPPQIRSAAFAALAFLNRNRGRRPRQAHGVLHQAQTVIAFRREDRLGMELHRLYGKLAMPHTHDHAVVRLRGDLQARGKGLAVGEQRMVAAHLKLLGQSLKYANTRVPHWRWLPMHRVIQHAELAPEGL